MRRRTLVVILASTAGFMVVGLLALAFFTGASPIDREHFDFLAVGAPRAEAERILGGAPRNECGDVDVWVRRDGRIVSAELPVGLVVLRFFPDAGPEAREVVWVGESGLIALLIGPDDRVQDKYFSTVNTIDRPTILSVCTRWFRR
jgi:hypothetical protein